MRLIVSRAATATLAASLVLLTGCTTVYRGVGVRDPHSDQKINVALLDTGSLPTKPQDPLGTAKTREAGAVVEGRRMAEVVVVPFEVDASLNKPGGAADVVTSGEDVSFSYFSEDTTVGKEIAKAVDDNDLVAGFKTNAESDYGENGLSKLKHVVLRFATPEKANAALATLADHTAHAPTEYNPERTEHAIPDHPDVRGFASDDEKRASVFGYAAHGPYLLVDWAEVAFRDTNLDDAVRMVATAVDKQIPALDGFEATPVDKLADLELDPTGLQARTLPVPKGSRANAHPGVYGAHGALHFMANPQRSQKLFDETGMTNLSRAGANVYQARNENAAQRLADDLIAEIGSMNYPQYLPDEPVANLPAARCMKPDTDSTLYTFRCAGSIDRYVIEVQGSNTMEARRMLAAQYVMLSE